MKATEIVERSGADKKTRHRVRRLLSELLEIGQIERGPGKRYAIAGTQDSIAGNFLPTSGAKQAATQPGPVPPKRRPLETVEAVPDGAVVGRILVHPGGFGFGFVQLDDGGDNVFVAARHRGVAMDRDKVALKVWQTLRGPEGRVLAILERGRARLTGTVEWKDSAAMLSPDDPRISNRVFFDGKVPRNAIGNAVVAEIIEYPQSERAPMVARLLSILGAPDDPRTEIEKILACEEVEERFPPAVEAEAKTVPAYVGERDPLDLKDREDLRSLPFVTIDPETARDFDDAICVETADEPGKLRLWVAVADVAHYVRSGTATDTEAERRGVSVYLPDRVIPMLPLCLSAGICSLSPSVDRLAMVVRLDVDRNGLVSDKKLMAAVIHSRGRLHYAGVGQTLFGTARKTDEQHDAHLAQLLLLSEVSRRLRDARSRRGGLDFELPEAKVELAADDPRIVLNVKRSKADETTRRAYQMVEDAMLAANEAVAEFFSERGLDVLWRVHAPPRKEPFLKLVEVARSLGVHLEPDVADKPTALRTFLSEIKGLPQERSLSYMVLRSLNQAAYSVDNVGHFGLGAKLYLHFTSPIRRYPDLVVHRLLKLVLRQEGLLSGRTDGTWPVRKEMKAWAIDSSLRERRAMEVEREVVDLYRALLMRAHIGEEFSGAISAVTTAGLFVELDDPFVEGLIPSERLDDEFELYDQKLRYRSERTGQSFEMGLRVRVRIDAVSVPKRRIDMSLVADETHPKKSKKPLLPAASKRPAPKRPTPTRTAKRRTRK
ncbi:MAG TPA: ribonuclease R [Pseudomonadota bacterium]|nr:ribonuclease R [Pseudomonadota bacterium]HMU39762.1 ribonuclease R [Pseudomonadota bacterium]